MIVRLAVSERRNLSDSTLNAGSAHNFGIPGAGIPGLFRARRRLAGDPADRRREESRILALAQRHRQARRGFERPMAIQEKGDDRNSGSRPLRRQKARRRAGLSGGIKVRWVAGGGASSTASEKRSRRENASADANRQDTKQWGKAEKKKRNENRLPRGSHS